MAGHTAFSQTDLVSILANYRLGGYRSARPFIHGTVQTNLQLRTTQGRFVLRYYENRSRNSVLFETDVIRYLNNRHFPCPAPLKNKYGEYVGTYNGHSCVIFEFVEGRHLEHPSATQKRALIRKVAELHNLTRAYRSRYAKYRLNYDIDTCRTLARRKAKAIGTPNAKNKLKWFESELSKLSLPKSLPEGICHCDFHFSNVLFKVGKFSALIDFDDANYTFLTFDLVSLIDRVIWSFDPNTLSDFKKGETILDFREARKIIWHASRGANTVTGDRVAVRLLSFAQVEVFDNEEVRILAGHVVQLEMPRGRSATTAQEIWKGEVKASSGSAQVDSGASTLRAGLESNLPAAIRAFAQQVEAQSV